jgi:nitrogen fixation protein FixH
MMGDRTKTLEPRVHGGRELTGRRVLIYVLAFFGVVVGVNAIMATAAITTFGGVETDSVYKAGNEFKNEVSAARAQQARHWRVAASIRARPPNAVIDVDVKNAAGGAPGGLQARGTLVHPTDQRRDAPIAFVEKSPGVFHGEATAAPGQWDLVIEFSHQGERVFRSKNRIILR